MPSSEVLVTALLIAATVLLEALLLTPAIVYLLSGLKLQRQEIANAFTDTALKKYCATFFPMTPGPKGELRSAFLQSYDARFGLKQYVAPLALFAVISTVAVLWLAATVKAHLLSQPFPGSLPPIASAAIAGAYLWTVSYILSHVYRRDLQPAMPYWLSLRFVVSVPIAYSIIAWAKADLAVPIAFICGAFPTESLLRIARRNLGQTLGLTAQTGEQTSQLELLQGMNTEIAENMQQANISTIVQLAYSDPVDLTMRTSLSFSFVIDLCSQALAWIYLETVLPHLRSCSIRGAQEIRNLVGELKGDDEELAEVAKRTMVCVAEKVQLPVEVIERTFDEIAEDPYTQFLADIWLPGV